jgi:hypothetical protein
MMSDSDGEVQRAHCDRCGTIGESLICIKANRKGGIENWKPLCDECLKELGEWSRSGEADTDPHGRRRLRGE